MTILQQMSTTLLVQASNDSPYSSGYDHGCNDAAISDPSERYINQPGKGPSFHTGEFMNGYYDGFDACSDGAGDVGNNAADGNLRVITSLDMGTYGNQYCASRTFDMRIYVQSELTQEKIVGACEDQETTFNGLNVATGSSFRVCAYGNDLDLSGCKTAINGPESKPERVTVRVS
ncbi:MAG: hypothetical protein GEU26_11595 [Nitrososphaeraceae archaeon]|nr:hypothetical protein [Nitrososphaeraceae archaeon]